MNPGTTSYDGVPTSTMLRLGSCIFAFVTIVVLIIKLFRNDFIPSQYWTTVSILAMFTAVSLLASFFISNSNKIELKGDHIEISSWRTSVVVPIREIRTIKEIPLSGNNDFLGKERYIIEFFSKTVFGREIIFYTHKNHGLVRNLKKQWVIERKKLQVSR